MRVVQPHVWWQPVRGLRALRVAAAKEGGLWLDGGIAAWVEAGCMAHRIALHGMAWHGRLEAASFDQDRDPDPSVVVITYSQVSGFSMMRRYSGP